MVALLATYHNATVARLPLLPFAVKAPRGGLLELSATTIITTLTKMIIMQHALKKVRGSFKSSYACNSPLPITRTDRDPVL
jgi:hypothetical protein